MTLLCAAGGLVLHRTWPWSTPERASSSVRKTPATRKAATLPAPDAMEPCGASAHAAKRKDTTENTMPAITARFPDSTLGIDVSHHDGRIDWSAVARSGIAFAYVKASQGKSFRDPCFDANARAAADQELLWGAYHVFNGGLDGTAQAEHFVATLGNRPYTLPPALDIELSTIRGVARKKVIGEIDEWLAHVHESTGKAPMVYIGHRALSEYFASEWPFDDSRTGQRIWFAEYSDATAPSYPRALPGWILWQFTSTAAIPGTNQPTDVNVFRGDREALASLLAVSSTQ